MLVLNPAIYPLPILIKLNAIKAAIKDWEGKQNGHNDDWFRPREGVRDNEKETIS